MQTFISIAADREESNAAGTDADGDTLQQRAMVVSFGWRCWLAHARLRHSPRSMCTLAWPCVSCGTPRSM